MMTMPLRPFLLLIALLACPPIAAAQSMQDDEDEVATIPVYDIELIVFEYVDGVRGSREDWAYIDTGREANRLALEAEAEARRAAEAMLAGETPESDMAPVADDTASLLPGTENGESRETPLALEFSRIDASAYRLQEQYERMRNSRDYRPLMHVAWRQPVYDQANETTLALDRLGKLPTSLAAMASIYVNRFLHLTLDLELAGGPALTTGDGAPQSTIYRLNERRKMRSAELHFFDHPRFGALALISRTDETRPAVTPDQ